MTSDATGPGDDPLVRNLADALRDPGTTRPAGVPSLPRYEIQGVLGEGATAVVYRARDVQLGRPVALKLLRENASLSPTARERFRREAQTAGSVNHPHVVQIYDAGEQDGRLYLVMELVDGTSFTDVLKSPPEPRRLLGIFEQACRGVGATHARGIVHRDLKPANILITAAGEAKVGDFGLAHLIESSSELTKTGATLGTPLYMSPEQAQGRTKDVTPATDVYALGTVLYQALTGAPPHAAETLPEIYAKILKEEPVRPRARTPGLAADLETIVLKAIDKDPRRRYATADQLADDLQRHLKGEPIFARPTPTIVRFVRRRARGVAATAAAVVVAGVLGFRAWSEAHERAAEREASKLLEEARPALESAFRSLYDPRTAAEDLAARVDAVGAQIDRAVAIAPRLAFARYLRGRAWEVRGDADRAQALTREGIELDPDFAPARYQLGRLMLAGAYEELVGAVPGTAESRVAGQRTRIEAAEREIEAALVRGKGLENALHRDVARALLAFTRGDATQARAASEEGLRRFDGKEGREEFWWILGLTSTGAERRKAFDEALRIRPKWPLLLLARAGDSLTTGRPEEAIADCDDLLRLRPGDPSARVNRGIARSQTGDLEGALADLDAAVAARPHGPLARYNRGLVRYRKGDPAGAIEDFTETLRVLPGFAPAYDNRGNARARIGRLDDALADFGEALRLAPDAAGPHSNRGRVRFTKGDLEGALADFGEALRIDPKFTEAFYNRALVRMSQDDPKGAQEDLGRAIALRPEWASPYAMRARVRSVRGDAAGARADARKALSLGADPADRAALERLLKSDE